MLEKVSTAPHSVAEHLPPARKGLVAPVLKFLEKKLASQDKDAAEQKPGAGEGRATVRQRSPPPRRKSWIAPHRAGIGVTFSDKEQGLQVVDVVAGGAASDYPGFCEVGDVLVAVDGHGVLGKTIHEASEFVLGDEGTQVEVTVQKASGERKSVKLTRRTPRNSLSKGASE